nr:hypothetical protein [Tanacetum cinerariifolium]
MMNENPDIPKRLHEHYHRVANDEIVKSIFNSRKNKECVGMQILELIMMEEMKLTRHYQLYVLLFEVDVPTTRSQPIESTQGTHRTRNAPRSPNHIEHQEEHLVDEEIKKIVEGNDGIDENEFMDDILNIQEGLDTRLEPRSHKKRPKMEKSDDVFIINDDEEEESVGDALIRKKGNGVHTTLKKVVSKMVDNNTNDFMKNNLPRVVAEAIKRERQNVKKETATMVAKAADISIWLSLKIKFERPTPLVEPCKVADVRTRDHEDRHNDDARREGESSARRQKTSEHGTFETGESSSSQAMDESTPSGLGT